MAVVMVENNTIYIDFWFILHTFKFSKPLAAECAYVVTTLLAE